MDVKQILSQLVRINSVSSRTNVEIASYLAEQAERAGLCARMLPYVDEAGVKKLQVIAVAPRETSDTEVIELALVGHTDTVQKTQTPFVFSPFLTITYPIKLAFCPSFTQDSHKESA